VAAFLLPEEGAALIAAFTAILLPEAETVSDPKGRSAAEDGSRATILLRAAKPPLRKNPSRLARRTKNPGRRRKIVARRHSKPDQGGGSFF
jgi:hypothetical protein